MSHRSYTNTYRAFYCSLLFNLLLQSSCLLVQDGKLCVLNTVYSLYDYIDAENALLSICFCFVGMFIFLISLRITLMNEFLVRKVRVGGFHTTRQTTQVFQSLNGCFLFLLRFISDVDHEFIFLMADFKHRR